MLGKYERASRSEENRVSYQHETERDILTGGTVRVSRELHCISRQHLSNAGREGSRINLRNERWGCTQIHALSVCLREVCTDTCILVKHVAHVTLQNNANDSNRIEFLDLSFLAQILSTNTHGGKCAELNIISKMILGNIYF